MDHVDTYALDTYVPGDGNEQIEGVQGIVYAIIFFVLLPLLYFSGSALFQIFSYLDARVSNKFLLAQLVALVSLVGGISLYFLREHKRMLYALLEMAFAIVTAGAAIYKLSDSNLNVWLALAASTYLVVRSLENMQKANFKLIDKCNVYVGEHVFRRTKPLCDGEAVKLETAQHNTTEA
jgi:hypothetical protein